jgi:hypothetical protein
VCPQLRKKLIHLFFLALTSIAFDTTVHAAVPAQHPHGHDCATAGSITLNSDVVATLVDTEDYAFYRIDLPQRGLLDVWIDPGAMDAWDMQLLDSACRPVTGVIGDESLLTGQWAGITVPHKAMFSTDQSVWTLPAGAYFIRVRPNPVDVFQERFTFHTKFIPHYGHDCDTAAPLRLRDRSMESCFTQKTWKCFA